jgi:hypothetical protein
VLRFCELTSLYCRPQIVCLNYLIIVLPPFIPTASAASATVWNFVACHCVEFGQDTGIGPVEHVGYTQRIHNLVTYLQELHSLGLANSDHTTLLLNTYTNLKDVAHLDSFIKTESLQSGDGFPSVSAGWYFEHALYLAKKYEHHEDYLRIQIEDAGCYKDTLVYLQMLGPEAVSVPFIETWQ